MSNQRSTWPPPPLDLASIPTDPALLPKREQVWPGFHGGVAAIAGEGSVGKSQLALQSLLAVVSESADLPILGYLPAPTVRGKAVYITLEDKNEDLQWRLAALRYHLIRTMGVTTEARIWRDVQRNLTVRSLIGTDGEKLVCVDQSKRLVTENVEHLRQLVFGAKVVCVDKIGDLAGDHENDNPAMRRLLGFALAGLADQEHCFMIGIADHVKYSRIEAEAAALLGAGSIRGKIRGGVVNLWPMPLADAGVLGINANDDKRYVLVRPDKINHAAPVRQCWLERNEHGVLSPTEDIPPDFVPGLQPPRRQPAARSNARGPRHVDTSRTPRRTCDSGIER